MSLKHDNLINLTLTSDSECERHHAPDPRGLTGKLLLADRGYDGTSYMEEICKAGGYFCIRSRASLDPTIMKIHRRGSRYRELEGKRLSAVLAKLPKGKTHDLDVAWFKRDGTVDRSFRLLLNYHGPEHGWMRLMTNLARDRFAATQIFTIYRLRWQVELYFKELKSYANLHAFSTSKAHIAEGLIWASLCAAFLKRYFTHGCQQVTGQSMSTRRVATCSHVFLGAFFRCMNNGFRSLRPVLLEIFEFLENNAQRSNQRRERKSGRLTLGLAPVGVAA